MRWRAELTFGNEFALCWGDDFRMDRAAFANTGLDERDDIPWNRVGPNVIGHNLLCLARIKAESVNGLSRAALLFSHDDMTVIVM